LARDLEQETVYIPTGGKIPVKWTAPEVCVMQLISVHNYNSYKELRQQTVIFKQIL